MLDQRQQEQVVFSTAGNHVVAAFDEHTGHGLGVLDHLLLVSLELRLQGFFEADRFGGDDVLQRATLGTWEYGGVQLLLDLGVGARQDQAATWAACVLCVITARPFTIRTPIS